ncbi:unnamed protein product [Effrenium voratum]|nr:unnamed protein product [Effrenium voratum]
MKNANSARFGAARMQEECASGTDVQQPPKRTPKATGYRVVQATASDSLPYQSKKSFCTRRSAAACWHVGKAASVGQPAPNSADNASAAEAIRMTDGSIHRGVQIRTLLSSSKGGEAKPISERPTMPSESLFVMGLPPGSTIETITAFFGQFAGVAFVKVLDTNGKKGDTVALVRMNSLDEAAWCVDRLNGHETHPNLQLVVRYSDPPRAKGTGKGMEEVSQGLGVRRGFSDSPYGEPKAGIPVAQRPVRSFTDPGYEAQGYGEYGFGQPASPPSGWGPAPQSPPPFATVGVLAENIGEAMRRGEAKCPECPECAEWWLPAVRDCEGSRGSRSAAEDDLEFVVSNKAHRSIGSESYRFIEEALNAAESVLIHSVRGQSRSCCILGAYMMKKYNWGLRKTMEFISFRRPDMNLKPGFMQQLSAFERRLVERSKQPLSTDWTDANFGNLEAEDLLLRNTYLNGQMGPLAEFHNDREAPRARRLVWLDQGSSDRSRLAGPSEVTGIQLAHGDALSPPQFGRHRAPGQACWSDESSMDLRCNGTSIFHARAGASDTWITWIHSHTSHELHVTGTD